MEIVKRDGTIVPFNTDKIEQAVSKCLLSNDVMPSLAPFGHGPSTGEIARLIADSVGNVIRAKGVQPTVEQVQDLVEQQLMANGYFDAAKHYILYRKDREAKRAEFSLSAEETAIVQTDRQFFPTELQAFQFKDKYSRWNDEKGRRETWQETVYRTMSFFRSQLVKTQGDPFGGTSIRPEEWQELEQALLSMEAMPSMRVLQMAGPALERCHVGVYNCAFTGISSINDFAEILYVLMQGTGCGYSVEINHVENLPRIKRQKGESSLFIVPDDTEGWCKALLIGLTEWFEGRDIEFDFGLIRPAGTPLKTKGGRASGPEPLKRLLKFARDKVLSRQGAWLRTIDAHDIACMCGDIVQVGGVRRAAEISLSDLSDHDMRYAKSGNWWEATPWRSMANNSAVYEDKPTSEQFIEEWLSVIKSRSGERGIFNRGDLGKQIPKRRKKKDFGCNPCGEILLRSKQFCNLSIAVAREDDTYEDLARKVRIATIFGTIQSMLTDFKFIGPDWKKNCEEERLLGVDIIGQWDCKLLRLPSAAEGTLMHVDGLRQQRMDRLRSLRQVAINTNKEFADRLGIQPSAAITCVKPGGNASVLLNTSPGMHPRMFQFYVRRVTVGTSSPMAKVLLDAGVPHVVRDEANLLFEFPERAPDGARTEGQVSAIDQLENWLDWKLNFTEHNPSQTIKVGEDEWLSVGNWVYEHWEQIGGLSFLPKASEDTVYKGMMPYEPISQEEYDRRVANMPKVDYAKLARYEREDMTTVAKEFACVSGVCAI